MVEIVGISRERQEASRAFFLPTEETVSDAPRGAFSFLISRMGFYIDEADRKVGVYGVRSKSLTFADLTYSVNREDGDEVFLHATIHSDGRMENAVARIARAGNGEVKDVDFACTFAAVRSEIIEFENHHKK